MTINDAYAGCVSGAALIAEVEGMLRVAGFVNVRVELKANSDALVQGWSPGAETLVASALIRGIKPRAAGGQG
jgi:arsenite methyltransferase